MIDLLRGQRFTVVSHGVAAAYAGWLLRELGAEVEHTTALDGEGVGLLLGQGARPSPPSPLPMLRERGGDGLGATLITDAPVSEESRRLLAELAREAHVIWLTPWGMDSEWAERPWSDLLLHAAGGWMSAVGEAGREPIGPPGAQGQFVAGLYAAIAALGPRLEALEYPAATGLTDVAMVECVATTLIYDSVAFQYFERLRARAGHRFSAAQPTLTTLPCKDGYVGIQAALHWQWLRLLDLIGHPELAGDPRFAGPAARAANVDALDAYFIAWLADKTRWEAYHALQEAGIPASATPTLAEVLHSPQLGARGFWETVTAPDGEEGRVPGGPARVTAVSAASNGARHEKGPWAPGKVRVVDLSMGWAGPLAGHALACLGADVIKVESHRRFDWWRGSRPPGDDRTLALHERSHVFNTTNRGKRGITLDLASEKGNDLVRELIGGADLVIENFRAGVMEKLGLDFATLSRDNPGLVVLRQPAFGADGPEAHYFAFGNTIEGMSGLTEMMGYEGGAPLMMSNAFGDPVSGLTGTIAAMAGLIGRAADGRGRCVESAQLEGFLPLMSEAFIAYQRTGALPQRAGNRRVGHDPTGAFRCAGEDEWVAIDVTSEPERQALARLVGEGGDLEAAVAAWVSERSRGEIVSELLATGVTAGPLNTEADVIFTEPFSARGLFAPEERVVTGTHLYPLMPLLHEGERAAVACAAPTLGQHNDEVLSGMGLLEGEIARLREEQIIGEWPG